MSLTFISRLDIDGFAILNKASMPFVITSIIHHFSLILVMILSSNTRQQYSLTQPILCILNNYVPWLLYTSMSSMSSMEMSKLNMGTCSPIRAHTWSSYKWEFRFWSSNLQFAICGSTLTPMLSTCRTKMNMSGL